MEIHFHLHSTSRAILAETYALSTVLKLTHLGTVEFSGQLGHTAFSNEDSVHKVLEVAQFFGMMKIVIMKTSSMEPCQMVTMTITPLSTTAVEVMPNPAMRLYFPRIHLSS